MIGQEGKEPPPIHPSIHHSLVSFFLYGVRSIVGGGEREKSFLTTDNPSLRHPGASISTTTINTEYRVYEDHSQRSSPVIPFLTTPNNKTIKQAGKLHHEIPNLAATNLQRPTPSRAVASHPCNALMHWCTSHARHPSSLSRVVIPG